MVCAGLPPRPPNFNISPHSPPPPISPLRAPFENDYDLNRAKTFSTFTPDTYVTPTVFPSTYPPMVKPPSPKFQLSDTPNYPVFQAADLYTPANLQQPQAYESNTIGLIFNSFNPELLSDYNYSKQTERKKKKKKSGCFIATAVYGHSEAYEVEVLRQFREEILMPKSIGRLFAKVYYMAGERAAQIITQYTPFLIKPIRKTLDKLVEKYTESKPLDINS